MQDKKSFDINLLYIKIRILSIFKRKVIIKIVKSNITC